MKEYVLTDKDYDWLNDLIRITTSIESLYRKMYELEISGNKNSEEYKKLIQYLDMSIEVEEDLYKRANLSFAKCQAITEHIFDDRIIEEDLLNDTESIINQDHRYRVLRRIINSLLCIAKTDIGSIQPELPEELVDAMEHMGISNIGQLITQSITSKYELESSFERDMSNGFLTILQEYINRYDSYRDDLLSVKYNLAFINKAIEADLRATHFEVPDAICSNSQMVAEFNQTNKKIYSLFKDIYGTKEATNQIFKIIEIDDTEYEDDKQAMVSILRQCLTRAAFLLISEDMLADMNYQFHDFIEGDEYIDSHPNNQKSEDAVISCFRAINRDKNKYIVLSL